MNINSKKIKVLFRHRSMEMGGVEKVVLNLLQNLNQEKFDITLCVNLYQGELRNEIPAHIKYIKLANGKEDFSKNSFIYKIQLVLRNLKLIVLEKFPSLIDTFYLKDKFDIEIATTYSVYKAVLSSSNKNSKKIAWLHSDITYPKLWPKVPLIIESIPKFHYLFYGSQQIEDILKEKFPSINYPEDSVIRNPINFHELYTKSKAFIPEIDKTIPTFCSVARLHSRKGFHKLLAAHHKLINEGFLHKIYIIGDGEEKGNFLQQRKELQVEESFIFLGTLKNPYPYVKHCNFYIMPSQSEGWPLIIAETLLLQKPIIATNVGGIPEMITHGKTGYLSEYNVESLYKAMKDFMTNNDKVSNIRKNLLNIEKQFNNQEIFSKIEKVLVNLYQQKIQK